MKFTQTILHSQFNSNIVTILRDFNINLNFKLVSCFFAFVILGYLLYAFLYAALGSLVSSTQDSTQATMPLLFLQMIIMFGGIMSLTNLDSTFAIVCSYIPFSSSIFMFERAIVTEVSVIEIMISIIILIISIIIIGILSSKVYKRGVLHYGKRASYFRTLLNNK